MRRPDRIWLLIGVTLLLLKLPPALLSQAEPHFGFTEPLYNASIFQDPGYKQYVNPQQPHMGVKVPGIGLPGNVTFKIENPTGSKAGSMFVPESFHLGDFYFLRLRTSFFADINREKQSIYNIIVEAKFVSTNSRIEMKNTTRVVIHVLDNNDNCPMFVYDRYDFTVLQNASRVTPVGQVHTTDADAGINAEVFYYFKNFDSYSSSPWFYVDPRTGVLFPTGDLSKAPSEMRLTVRAMHRGDRSIANCDLISQVSVRIKVLPVNSHPPDIFVTQLDRIMTPGKRDTIYAKLIITDKDKGLGGQIDRVSIIESSDARNYFEVAPSNHPSEYLLRIRQEMHNISIRTRFLVVIEAIDKGSPPLNSTKRLTFDVVTIRTYKIKFPSVIYTEVPENVIVNSTVYFLIPDMRYVLPNMNIQYTQANNYGATVQFIIDKYGSVVNTGPLDAEQTQQVEIPFKVSDNNNFYLTSLVYAKLVIKIIDVNDLDPIIKNTGATVDLSEVSSVGSRVLKIDAYDPDISNTTLHYYLFHTKDLPFALDPLDSKWVIVSKPLDAETMPDKFTIKVRVRDTGLPFPKESFAEYIINIKDVNEFRPRFVHQSCRVKLSRDAPVGTTVGDFYALDFDRDSRGDVQIYVDKSNFQINKCFKIDPTRGGLTLMCSYETSNSANLGDETIIVRLIAKDRDFTTVFPLHITLTSSYLDNYFRNDCPMSEIYKELSDLENKRDTYVNKMKTLYATSLEKDAFEVKGHAPLFKPELPRKLHIREDVSVGSTVQVIHVIDKDDGSFLSSGKIIYGIISHVNKPQAFLLEKVSNEKANLVVKRPLNLERISQYDFTIVACDQGKPQLCSSSNMTVMLSNVNNYPPEFTESYPPIYIPENTQIGTKITQINAVDRDAEVSMETRFRLVNFKDQFKLRRRTGRLKLKQALDRETVPRYDIVIVAEDSGSPPLSSTLHMTIFVTDVNDNTPKFNSKSYSLILVEDLPVGSYVTTLQAHDQDSGFNGKIHYSLSSNRCFQCDKATGVVILTCELDYTRRYALTALATDQGDPPLEDQAQFEVRVQGFRPNVYAPVFEEPLIQARILENQPEGSFVAKVTAVDKDDTVIIYSIGGGSGLGRFKIDNSGVVRTNEPLDSETAAGYWLVVWAEDSGSVSQRSFCEVFVQVVDSNDHCPVPAEPSYKGIMSENSEPGVRLVRVQAYDLDRAPQTLRYKVVEGNTYVNFVIDANTGVISTTARPWDRERNMGLGMDRRPLDEVDLIVEITDNGSPPCSTKVHVYITILDENDNHPEFWHTPGFELKIFETASLTEANGTQKLPSADMTLLWPRDPQKNCIGRVFAHDDDAGVNGTVRYILLSGGLDLFVEEFTGRICTNKTLTAGTTTTLNITAEDMGQPSLKANQPISVDISIIDRPHYPMATVLKPSPLQGRGLPDQLRVREVEPPGKRLVEVVVVDESQPKVGTLLSYSVPERGPFGIDVTSSSRAYFFVAGHLNFTQKSFYSLTISVTDGFFVFNHKVNITVEEYNAQPPHFLQTIWEASVSEAASPGSIVLQLLATNSQGDKNHLFFSLTGASEAVSTTLFKLDDRTGLLTVAEPLNHEHITQHILFVTVRDSGTPLRYAHARVIITVTDVNEYAPQFLIGSANSANRNASAGSREDGTSVQTAVVFSTAPIGSIAAHIAAFDPDVGDNGKIRFSLIRGDWTNLVDIDKWEGVVRVTQTLLKHEGTTLDIGIQAQDFGVPPKINQTILALHIRSPYLNSSPPPIFNLSTNQLTVSIPENVPRGYLVASVRAECSGPVYYRIVPSITGHEDLFGVTATTGSLITKTRMDRERHGDLFTVTIEAVGADGKVNIDGRSRLVVKIHLLDENDNAPRFLNLSLISGSVYENSPIGTVIRDDQGYPITLAVVDPDFGLNGSFTYQVESSPAVDHFSVLNTTGALVVSGLLDRENISSYQLWVTAVDQGSPQLTSLTALKVNISVLDVSDSPPVFLDFSTSLSSAVSSGPKGFSTRLLLPVFRGAPVMKVKVRDPDLNDTVLLSITNGNQAGHFSLDSTTGQLTIANERISLDQTFHLQVVARDTRYSSRANITIHCQHLSGERLVLLTPDSLTVHTAEGSPPGHVLARIQVYQPVRGEVLRYSLLTPSPMVVLEEFSGLLSTSKVPLDREKTSKLELLVLVRDRRQRFAHVAITVVVDDANDNSPVFVGLPYHAVLFLDAQLKGNSFQITAIDKDRGSNGSISYTLDYIRPYADLSMFHLDRQSGLLSLARNLSRDALGHRMQVGVVARDNGRPHQLSSSAVISLQLVSRLSPVFQKTLYKTSVSENLLPGESVITVQAENSPSHGGLLYTIQAGNEEHKFQLDFNTGVVRIVDKLDYEVTPQYTLELAVTDTSTGLSSNVNLIINVTDTNDNSPKFLQNQYTVNVSEIEPIGFKVLRVSATDLDTGDSGKVTYKLEAMPEETKTGAFSISPKGWVSVAKPLDREKVNFYRMWIVAMDLGVPELTSKAMLNIFIKDYNDNAPHFEHSTYNVTIADQSAADSFVVMVTAEDADQSDVAKLKYAILPRMDYRYFRINKATGRITYSPPHRRAGSSRSDALKIQVSVSDGVHSTTALVIVNLLPSNQASPQFEPSVRHVTMLEGQPVGSWVTNVTAQDSDHGPFGRVSYSIPSDEGQRWFSVDRNTGRVTIKRVLDREAQSQHQLVILGQDGGGRFGYLTLFVHVQDVNDNSPLFRQKQYEITLTIDQQSNQTPFLRLVADDPDTGVGGEVIYRFLEGNNKYFNIDRETGDLTLIGGAASPVGTEQMLVEACDKGLPTNLCSPAVEVIVHLLSRELDHPLPIVHCAVAAVMENNELNSHVASCKVSPNIYETDANLVGEWSLLPGFESATNSEPAAFKINRLHGEVLTERVLDYEVTSRYRLTVQFRTVRTEPPLITTRQLNVDILDVNDCRPEFDSRYYSLTLPENTPPGTPLLQALATDRDMDGRDEVTYSLQSRLAAPAIQLDEETGWLTLTGRLDKEIGDGKLEMIVIGRDSSGHTNQTRVRFNLLDINDSPLEWPPPESATVQIRENMALPADLYQLRTMDQDHSQSSSSRPGVRYYLASGGNPGVFTITPGGMVCALRPLDREERGEYRLELKATDGLFTTERPFWLTVEVLDENDNSPVCLQPIVHLIKPESLPSGSPLFTVKASHADVSPHSTLTFTLVSGDANIFRIDPSSGLLTTRTALDRETAPARDQQNTGYHLLVRVTDPGRHSCTTQIFLEVTDVNDNAPVFTSTSVSAIPESANVGSLLGKVHAEDADLGVNRRIRYSIVGADKSFTVDPITGILAVARPLDREKQAVHSIVVMATDGGSPALSSTATIRVRLLDVNDSPPRFVHNERTIRVSEDAPVGKSLLNLEAISADEGENARITYRMLTKRKEFSLDPGTGELKLSSKLNYEGVREYYLTVEAVDGGEPPLSSTTVVTVKVLDVNDNSPQFPLDGYHFLVPENVNRGYQVGQLQAVDLDSGPSGSISYSLINPPAAFRLDPTSGRLSLIIQPDREKVARYDLTVRAEDNGSPPLTATAPVIVEIEDVNDNSPTFDQKNYVFVVQVDRDGNITSHTLENSSAEIGRLKLSDKDAPSNAGPFACRLIHTQAQHIFSVRNSSTDECVVMATGRLTVGSRTLRVRVNDNGQTARYNTTTVLVNVVRQSNIPPEIVRVNVTLTYYRLARPSGQITRVRVRDRTPYDRLHFELTSRRFSDLFTIGSYDGEVRATDRLDSGLYPLTIRVNNGSLASQDTIFIRAVAITEEMVQAACIVRIQKHLPNLFFVDKLDSELKASVASLMEVADQHVYLLSVQSAKKTRRPVSTDFYGRSSGLKLAAALRDTNMTSSAAAGQEKGRTRERRGADSAVDILIAVYNPVDRVFFTADHLRNRINSISSQLSGKFRESVKAFTDVCRQSNCPRGQCQTRIVMDTQGRMNRVDVHSVTQSSPEFAISTRCVCMANFGGPLCDIELNQCARRPCPSPKVCEPQMNNRYRCVCPPMRTGPQCRQLMGGEVGPDGDCNDDNCRRRRENGPLMFSGSAYMNWTLLDPLPQRIELAWMMRTRQSDGPIIKVQWNSLRQFLVRLEDGRISCGPVLQGSPQPGPWITSRDQLNDASWHTVRFLLTTLPSSDLQRTKRKAGKTSEPTVKRNPVFDVSETASYTSLFSTADQQWWAELTIDGVRPITSQLVWQQGDVSHQTILIGADVRPLPQGAMHFKNSFAGCLRNLQVNDASLPLQSAFTTSSLQLSGSSGVQFTCAETFLTGPCGPRPCHHGGVCSPARPSSNSPVGQLPFRCQCRSPFGGPDCLVNTDPCSLKPCLNKGRCEATPSRASYVCHCPPGTSGVFCQHASQCPDNLCLHRAECQETISGPLCLCPAGYTGARCEHDVDECREQAGLCNGRGVCRNLAGGFRCSCALGYTGNTCNREGLVPLNPDSNPLGLTQLHVYIIVGMLAFLFLSALFTIVLLVCRYRRPTRSSYDSRRRQASLNDLEKDSRIQMLPLELGYSRATSHCSLASSSMLAARHHHLVHHPHRSSLTPAHLPSCQPSPPTTPTCSLYKYPAHIMPHHLYHHGSMATGSDRLSPCSSIATITERGTGIKRPYAIGMDPVQTGSSSQEGSDELNNPTPVNSKRRRRQHRPMSAAVGNNRRSIDPSLMDNFNRDGEGKMDSKRKSLASFDPSTCAVSRPYTQRSRKFRKPTDGYHWDMMDLQPAPPDIPDVICGSPGITNGNGGGGEVPYMYQQDQDPLDDGSALDEDIVTEMSTFLPPDVTARSSSLPRRAPTNATPVVPPQPPARLHIQQQQLSHARVPLAAYDDDDADLGPECNTLTGRRPAEMETSLELGVCSTATDISEATDRSSAPLLPRVNLIGCPASKQSTNENGASSESCSGSSDTRAGCSDTGEATEGETDDLEPDVQIHLLSEQKRPN